MRDASLLFLTLISMIIFSCKPAHVLPNSNSLYKKADMYAAKLKEVMRDSTGAHSTGYEVYGDCKLDTNTLKNDPHIYLNGLKFDGPNFTVPDGWLYELAEYGQGSPDTHDFDMLTFKVVSQNGVNDLEYAMAGLPYYSDSIPYYISKSQDLTLLINPSTFTGIDSIHFIMGAGANKKDTVVNTNTGAITFKAATLSSIFTQPYKQASTIGISVNKTYVIENGGHTFNIVNVSESFYDILVSP